MRLPSGAVDQYVSSLRNSGITLQERAGIPTVLMYSTYRNTSSWMYRVSNLGSMLTALGGRVFFAEKDNAEFHDYFAKQSDLLFIHRSGYTPDLEHLIDVFRSQRKPVIFDTDDLVIHIDNIPGLLSALGIPNSNEDSLNYWYSYVSRHQVIVQTVDYVVTSTDEISEFAADKFGLPSTTVRNFPMAGQFTVSEGLANSSKSKVKSVGYFSGSPSHRLDFQLVERPLVELIAKERLQLTLAGFIEASIQGHKDSSHVKYIGLTDSEKLIGNIASVDLNIAPLRKSQFTDSKSALKIFDAALAGTFTYASPSREYMDFSIKTEHKFSSIVNDSEWLDSLEDAVDYGVPGVSRSEARIALGELALRETSRLIEICKSIL